MDVWKKGELNDEQISAIIDPESVFLVACPGSGKTRTLTYKIASELSKLNSAKKWVIAITYTNRAADEIHERVENMGISTNQLWIGTIHAFCLEWIIKPYGIYHEKLKNGYRIINSHDTEKILTELCGQYTTPKIQYFDCNNFYDSNGINISCTGAKRENVESVLNEYQHILENNQQIDFELILWYSYQLITQKTPISRLLSKIFSYILVDEFQDTKEIQYQIISSILKAGKGDVKAFVVGDPNQSIFTSLGGYAISIEELKRMSSVYFEPMELSKNYRNSKLIVDYFSNFKVYDSEIESEAKDKRYASLISFNRQIPREDIINEIARIILINIEQYKIPASEICVVGPWWIHLAALTRGLAGALPNYGFDGPGLTPFVQDVENFWYRLARIILTRPSPHIYIRRLRWAKEIIENLSDAGADISHLTVKELLRTINDIDIEEQDGLIFLSKYFDVIFDRIDIDYSILTTLKEHRDAFLDSSQARISRIQSEGVYYAGEVEAFYRAFESRNGIAVPTIHGVKGAEFDTIIAFAMLDGAVPHFSEPNQRESAKKLLYVIGSRARKNLHLISETGRNQRNPTPELVSLKYQYSEI